MRTFTIGNTVYSADMAIAWVNEFRPQPHKIVIKDLIHILSDKAWDYDATPLEVIIHPKKYPQDYERIINADLRYPIIVYGELPDIMVIDGYHRVSKAFMEGKKTISAVTIPTDAFKKFKLETLKDLKGNDPYKLPYYEVFKILDIYNKRFHVQTAKKKTKSI